MAKNKTQHKAKKEINSTKTRNNKTSQKSLQKATSENLLHNTGDDVTEIIEFLKRVQFMSHPMAQSPSKLISLKVPEHLLEAFRFKAQSQGVPYQTMIKKLMHQWLFSSSAS